MKKGAKNSISLLVVAAICALTISSCGSKQGCSAYGKYGKHHKVAHR